MIRSLAFLGSRRAARRGAVIWALFLFTLTSWPNPPQVPVVSNIPDFDKLVHITLYGVEALLLYLSIRWPGRRRFSLLRVVAVVGGMSAWGVADETHQAWIPGRSMDAADVAADVTGACAGALIASAASARREGISRQPSMIGQAKGAD